MKYIILALLALAVVGFFLNVQTPAVAPSVTLKQAETTGIPSEILEQFAAWKLQYHRNYATQEESQYRLDVFYANALYIIAENNMQNEYVLGETQFMDITQEEFVGTYLGMISDSEHEVVEEDFIPSNAAFSWVSQGAVGPVKNQGQCGSCWAFSITGLVEGYWKLNKGSLPSLSEQQLVDCAGLAYGNLGCNGGNPYSTLSYVINKGLVTESQYPYTGRDGTCKINSGPYKSTSRKATSGCTTLTADIKTQPTSVAVDASNWSLYRSGIFSNCGTQLNHAVLAVGWDANSNWSIKNSWGVSWGVNGYITLKTGNTCGVCNEVSNTY